MRIAVIALAVAGCGAVLYSVTRSQAPSPPPIPRVVEGLLDHDGIRLSYRVTRPEGPGPFPAIVIGHGSGRATKETCTFIARRFVERGYAVYCYDKRGVGASTGEYSGIGTRNSHRMFDLLASDMVAGVEYLRAQPDIRRDRVALAGVSQAGWIIPLAAARAKPAFMVIWVGPTVSVGIENFYSRFSEGTATPLEEIYRQLPSFAGEHGYDPRPILESLDTPGLWLLAGADRSIPTPRTVEILDELIAAGRPFSHVVYPGEDHQIRVNVWGDVDRFLARLR